MTKKVVVHAVVREDPDVHLFVLALIELARQLQDRDQGKAAAGGGAHARP